MRHLSRARVAAWWLACALLTAGVPAAAQDADYGDAPAAQDADYGDAPAPYPTLKADGGASHAPSGPMLGSRRDAEPDGTPSAPANGDGSDEDGVSFPLLRVGQVAAPLTVTVSGGSARLDAWIDFDGDGSWAGPGEQVARGLPLSAGTTTVRIRVPATALPGNTLTRFRLSSAGGLGPGGAAADGEVEDYRVNFEPPAAGPGHFATHVLARELGEAHDVDAVDLDGDHDLDLLAAATGSDRVLWFRRDADGFSDGRVVATDIAQPVQVRGADIDNDGDADVLAVSQATAELVLYRNLGDGTFGSREVLVTGLHGLADLLVADLNADGSLDLVASAVGTTGFGIPNVSGTARLAWYANKGDGSFRDGRTIAGASFTGDIPALALVDLDRDSRVDIVAALEGDNQLAWYRNLGGAFGGAHLVSNALQAPRGLATTDLNGDGEPDLLLSSDFASQLLFFAGGWDEVLQTRTFADPEVLANVPAGQPTAITAVDLDGDGRQDVVSHQTGGDRLTWFRNEGDGFAAPQPVDAFAKGLHVFRIADLDQDGDLDLLSAGGGSGRVAWHEQRPASEPPSAASDGYAGPANAPLQDPAPGVLQNDSDPEGAPLTLRLIDRPRHGTVDLDPDGGFTYEPFDGFIGTDTFTYVASDGTADSDLATVSLAIGAGGRFHPADTNLDNRLSIAETTGYGAAWKRGDSWPTGPSPVPIGYATRAGFLWISGEGYRDAGGALPEAWVPR